jgi:hypothetical protein
MEQSRFYQYSTTRIPKRKRTVRLQGSFDDRGKYIRCWQCGFIVDTQRDLGNPGKTGGYVDEAEYSETEIRMSGNNKLYLDANGYNQFGVGPLIKLKPDGTAITDYYVPKISRVSMGCPLCGVTNL